MGTNFMAGFSSPAVAPKMGSGVVSLLVVKSGRSAVPDRAYRKVNSCLGLLLLCDRRSLPRNSKAGGIIVPQLAKFEYEQVKWDYETGTGDGKLHHQRKQ